MNFRFRFFAFLLAAVLLFTAAGVLRIGASETQESTVEAIMPANDGVTRILVMGCDRAAGLTDSIFVVTLDEGQKKATILQIPRDTYAEYTAHDYKKLNGARHAIGAEKTKDLLSEALGIRLDYYVTLDLDCVRRLVDAVGGVDVVLPDELYYSDPAQNLEISLPKGYSHLDGARAEQLIRFRSGYVNADLGRLDAQKLFLQAFAKQCKRLTPVQMVQVLGLVFTHVQTNIDWLEAIRVGVLLLEFDAESIPMATLAGEAIQGNSGAWYYVLNKSEACRMVNEYCLPPHTLTESEFDPNGIFDRADHPDFHKIYSADPKGLGG